MVNLSKNLAETASVAVEVIPNSDKPADHDKMGETVALCGADEVGLAI